MVINLSRQYKLLDYPNLRKEHGSPTPTLGGIGIFLGALVATLFCAKNQELTEAAYLLAPILVLIVLGIRDDLKEVRAIIKFAIQIGAVGIALYGGHRIESGFGFLGLEELSLVQQYIFSGVVILGVINAFNLIDGVDGLAGGLGLINAFIFGILFASAGEFNYATLSFALAGSLLGFLKFNFNPAKIFMGDTGSMLVGFLMAILGIKALSIGSLEFGPVTVSYIPVVVFGIFLIPVFDMGRIMLTRISKGKHPFRPDRNHLHHRLLQKGLNAKRTSVTLYVGNLLMIALAILLSQFFLNLGISVLILVAFLFTELITFRRKSESASPMHPDDQVHPQA